MRRLLYYVAQRYSCSIVPYFQENTNPSMAREQDHTMTGPQYYCGCPAQLYRRHYACFNCLHQEYMDRERRIRGHSWPILQTLWGEMVELCRLDPNAPSARKWPASFHYVMKELLIEVVVSSWLIVDCQCRLWCETERVPDCPARI